MPGRVHVVATFAVRADAIDAFIDAANRLLVDPTRGEAGCMRYELCQDAADASRFAMLETWANGDDLERHLAQPSLGRALDELRGMVTAAPQVTRYIDTE